MDLSVLTLGERLILAARMAAIEHVRQELAEEAAEEIRRIDLASAPMLAAQDPAPVQLSRPVGELLTAVFKEVEAHNRMPRVKAKEAA